ncbi:MAG TPA: nucleotidyl transferase AbiEii/AbiGii toxin family protein [Burkholderiales bacterium]|nr:nucleotidyl transferase AbiEii/AbiGii toxin family protein [Burkholderiales bacterium]
MADDPLKIWETLWARALELIDSVVKSAPPLDDWSFGGGTVLMRRYRLSKDIDIFISDPQYLGHLTPRLNSDAEKMTSDYTEDARFLKLRFAEGEIDFVASAPLTQDPTITEVILGRDVAVETSAEILAKKLWHRGKEFKARDIFDFALVVEKEPQALRPIAPILRDRREVILRRIESSESLLRQEFELLKILDYRHSFDECVGLVTRALGSADRT